MKLNIKTIRFLLQFKPYRKYFLKKVYNNIEVYGGSGICLILIRYVKGCKYISDAKSILDKIPEFKENLLVSPHTRMYVKWDFKSNKDIYKLQGEWFGYNSKRLLFLQEILDKM